MEQEQLLSIRQASDWASSYLGKNVTPSNIAYLIQYGRIKKRGENGSTQVSLNDLQQYYQSYNGRREVNYKDKLGSGLKHVLNTHFPNQHNYNSTDKSLFNIEEKYFFKLMDEAWQLPKIEIPNIRDDSYNYVIHMNRSIGIDDQKYIVVSLDKNSKHVVTAYPARNIHGDR